MPQSMDSSKGVIIKLRRWIDFDNVRAVEEEIGKQLEGRERGPVILDASPLRDICSEGLRMILRLNDKAGELRIINAVPEMYELLDYVGFTERMTVEKGEDPVLWDDELEVKAVDENLHEVLDFIEENLEEAGCQMKELMQIRLAAEEIFINIAHYAYAPDTGRVNVTVEVEDEPRIARLIFKDSGVPYDPLAKEDPDVSLPAGERKIGGLGIFLVKKTMDEMRYVYRDGCNILILEKRI